MRITLIEKLANTVKAFRWLGVDVGRIMAANRASSDVKRVLQGNPEI
jgi:hypothetical protein